MLARVKTQACWLYTYSVVVALCSDLGSDIKKAYFKAARLYHPDKVQGSTKDKEIAKDNFQHLGAPSPAKAR